VGGLGDRTVDEMAQREHHHGRRHFKVESKAKAKTATTSDRQQQ
jgi:hypothetical protein